MIKTQCLTEWSVGVGRQLIEQATTSQNEIPDIQPSAGRKQGTAGLILAWGQG